MRELSVLIEKTSGAVSGTAMMFNGGAGASLLIFPELAAKVVGTGALSRVIGKLFGGRIPRIYLLVIVLAAINLANAAELDGRIRLTGSSTIAPLVLEIARRFEESHDNVRIDVESGGSQRGINDLIQQRVDMALVSRALSKAEVDEVGLVENAIAHDGLCLIVHKNNPIFQINRPDLLGIYKGEITNWSDIGGPNIPITVITKADGRATLDVFLTETGLKVTDIKAHVIIGENLQGIKTVSGNEGAIAYVSIGAAVASARAGDLVKLIPLRSVEHTDAAVFSGTYQPFRPLLIVNLVGVELSPLGQAFLDYAQSAAVHDIIEDYNFAPIN